ncbi:hypothetical protein WJX84_009415 [Apatococcus fuscideae]|uniref:EF-hand domain-containing protein n=1 Tax=Apatococcus fuscideae TaxID=2026836 RepID=A0AAW1T4Q9_9CHLO
MDRGMNLEQLLLMKEAFESTRKPDGGELTQEEFFEKLSPFLGTKTSREAMAQTFMKIDADCGGTVSWDEFTNYFFLQRTASKNDDKTDWKLVPQALSGWKPAPGAHRDAIQKLYYYEPLDRLIACGQDGSFSFWNAQNMSHHKTYHHEGVWANDCIYLPVKRMLACASFNETVSFFDLSRGTFKMASMADSPDRLLYQDNPQDMEWVHQEHSDWVTQLSWQPDLGLISSSLDTTIKITDVTKGVVWGTATVHSHGVSAFVYSNSFSVMASGGVDRDILLWEPSNLRRVGELAGHTAPITHLCLDSSASQVISMSSDSIIKLWDLRNNRCMQTLTEKSWAHTSHAHPAAMIYEPRRNRVVTIQHQPMYWRHMCCADDQQGHSQPLVAVLYSPEFHLAVSGDDSGTICVWDTKTGTRDGHFMNLHGNAKLTAMSFDVSGRRLLTASDTGEVSMWNFTNGSRLRRFAHHGPKLEFTCLLYICDEARQLHQVIAAGWDRQLHIWEDLQEDEVVKEGRTIPGDGCIRTWQTHGQGRLLDTTEVGLTDRMASCTALAKDSAEKRIAVGMSDGILCMWKLVAPTQPSFSCQLHQGPLWTAATAAVTGVHFMKDCNMLVVASQDTSVGLWSTAGQLIGKCGQHTWTLNNQLTWQHNDASVLTGLESAPSTISGPSTRPTATPCASITSSKLSEIRKGGSTAEQLSKWSQMLPESRKTVYPELHLSPPASLAELSKWQKNSRRGVSVSKMRRQ